jgi:hypothetical protein
MNTYSKYCPNVWVAKCAEMQEKGNTIFVSTKYGKDNECLVHNLVGRDKEGNFYYSITRVDGFNSKVRAEQKANKLQGFLFNAEKRSLKYYESSQEGKEFLLLAEPIKIGHHSEKRHRALIERNWNRMGKCVEESKKAETYAQRAEYWEKKSNKIDLSMPESIEYFEYKLEAAKLKHEGLKNGTIKREHSFSLTYAKKEVNEAEKNLEMAKKLWK